MNTLNNWKKHYPPQPNDPNNRIPGKVYREDIEAVYDWCWGCCQYHKNGQKECKPRKSIN